MGSYFICTHMSFVCQSYLLVCHPYVTCMHSYVTRMYSYVMRMSLVCTRMSSVCHSYVVLPWTDPKLEKNLISRSHNPRANIKLSQEYKFDKICGIIFWKIWTCLKRPFLFIPSLSHNLKEQRALSNNCVAIFND